LSLEDWLADLLHVRARLQAAETGTFDLDELTAVQARRALRAETEMYERLKESLKKFHNREEQGDTQL